jgi:ribonuclease inhibitor
VTHVLIDGSTIHTEADIHRLLASQLGFPPYYGNNVHALWDCLTVDVERPVDVLWINSEASRAVLGDEAFERLKGVLVRVMEWDRERSWKNKFTVRFEL